MKRLLFFLVLCLSLAMVPAMVAQDSFYHCTLTATGYCPGSGGSATLVGGIDTHNVYIVPVGTPGTITVLLQGSVIGDFNDAVTCGTSTTTTANLLSCSGIYTKTRISVTLAGFTSVNVTYVGVSSVAKNPPRLFAGAPTGSCNSYNLAVNQANGNFYDCLSGSWNQIGGGGGTGNANYTGTQNVIPKGSATAHTLGDSSITDNGTTVSTTEPMAAASFSSVPTGGVGGGIAGPEGTVPSTIGGITIPQAGYDGCYFDSTAHGWKCSFNNGAFALFPAASLWNTLGNPTGNLALSNGTYTSILSGTAQTSQFFALKNTTAAVVGTSQGSDAEHLPYAA